MLGFINNDGLADPKKHIQNVRSILNLMTTNNDTMCKTFPITFRGFATVCYHSLKPGFILGLHDLHVKFISYFSTNIPTKKSTIKLFSITQ